MKVSRSKAEYMCVSEKGRQWHSAVARSRGGQGGRVQVLGSTIQCNGDGGSECIYRKRVQAGWSGWRKVAGEICDRRVPAEMKGQLYKTVLRETSYVVWVLIGESGADKKTGDGA